MIGQHRQALTKIGGFMKKLSSSVSWRPIPAPEVDGHLAAK